MSMERRDKQRQNERRIATSHITIAPGHPFFAKLNRALGEAGFDRFVEQRCERFSAQGVGRQGTAPGVSIRMLMIGSVEGSTLNATSCGAAPTCWFCTQSSSSCSENARKKKASNDDWQNPHDPDARITKMKDGRTHLRGYRKVLKRLLIHAGAGNLALLMRLLHRAGTPRALAGLAAFIERIAGCVRGRTVIALLDQLIVTIRSATPTRAKVA